MIKKLFTALSALFVSLSAMADEGMWLLPYLQKMNIGTMKQLGLELDGEDIYSEDNTSLKDAVVIFGAGCTGEIVSPNGLLFTNHHCGYSSIQELSSVDHDYLKYGYWANNFSEEIPAPGLKATFIRRIIDVSGDVLGNIPNISTEKEREHIAQLNIKILQRRLVDDNPGMMVRIVPFFGGNQYFAFVMEVYRDVRLVGTPPSSIGKFGGETDNWMWPRHTGDFSIFRIYANKYNRPADYSEDNVPYKAETYLKISTKGFNEGDFAMIMGFPGSTDRYMTSYEIDYMLQVDNPQRIFIRGERQKILKEYMSSSDKIRIQYAAKYAQSSNYWKNSIGMSRGIEKLDVRSKKLKQEQDFQTWADRSSLPEERFMDALPLIKESVEDQSYAKSQYQYLREAFDNSIEIMRPVQALFYSPNQSQFPSFKGYKLNDRAKNYLKEFYKDYDVQVDKSVAKRMLTIARENMKELPSVFSEVIDKKFGGDISSYVDYLYENSNFTSYDKAVAYCDGLNSKSLKKDPAAELSSAVRELKFKFYNIISSHIDNYNEGHRLYIAGLMRQNPTKAWTSDANSTLRLTYGQILSYRPSDAVFYKHFTTLDGVMQKEDKNSSEFFVPEKLKELYKTKDYGRWADNKGRMPVAFLANCDITGGNSGSPVLNSSGELIGLAFDGNWEAMSGDVAFEPELQRTISVDIRYVLFIVDKFASCQHIINELDIVE